MPLSQAFLHRRAAASITPGLDVFVQEVMAAMTTEPCFRLNYYPLKVNLVFSSTLFSFSPKPLNPVGLVSEVFQSFFKSLRAT